MSINHQAEMIEALPHEYGCFEIYAEKLIEDGITETGEYDEILDNGVSVIGRFHQEMTAGTAKCECQAPIRAAALAEDARLGR